MANGCGERIATVASRRKWTCPCWVASNKMPTVRSSQLRTAASAWISEWHLKSILKFHIQHLSIVRELDIGAFGCSSGRRTTEPTTIRKMENVAEKGADAMETIEKHKSRYGQMTCFKINTTKWSNVIARERHRTNNCTSHTTVLRIHNTHTRRATKMLFRNRNRDLVMAQ